ncbi:MAG: SEC-C domain-containing protein [Methylococcales bacterium]
MIDKLGQQISFTGNWDKIAAGITAIVAPVVVPVVQGVTLASVWTATTAAAAAAAPFVIAGGAIAGIAYGVAKLVKEDGTNEKQQSFANAARNDPCPCGSGLKFRQCHGKLK